MSHDDEQGDVQVLGAVLHGCKDRFVDHFSRRANHEEVTKADVEDVSGGTRESTHDNTIA